MKQNNSKEGNQFKEVSFLDVQAYLEKQRRDRPWYINLKWSIIRTWNRFLDVTYWKLHNWNWKSMKPRGFDSKHGYADTVELIPGQMFALFMRYYEGEYLTQQYLYTEANLAEKLADPDSFQESAEHIKRHLVFQRRIEWVAHWIKTEYDLYEKKQFELDKDGRMNYSLEYEDQYLREMQKAMHIIVKYHGWMWT